MLARRLTPHLQKLADSCPAVARQFIPSNKERFEDHHTFVDPLLEENHTVTRGLVYKYGNRALILLTMNCAAYCRFCTRRRSVSDIERGMLTDKDLNKIVAYLKKHPQIKEIIFSGGDPLTVPNLLKKVLVKISRLSQIKVIRFGTRVVVSAPNLIDQKVLSALRVVKRQPLYLMVHFEHPPEITPASVAAVKKLQSVSTMVMSQSVFLKGVNDSVKVLDELFSGLIEIGVKPYYIYHCDPVKGAEHFIMPIKKEIQIMWQLRKKLSGLAFPLHVVDTPNGAGKVPAPTAFWKYDASTFRDFNDKWMKI